MEFTPGHSTRNGRHLPSGSSVLWESFLRDDEMQKSVVHSRLSGSVASPWSSLRMWGG